MKKKKTLRWLVGLGLGAGLVASGLSFASCSEPPTACLVGSSPYYQGYVAVMTPTSVPDCAKSEPRLLQKGDVFGMENYHPGNMGSAADGYKGSTTYDPSSSQIAIVSDTMDLEQQAYSDELYPDMINPSTGGPDLVFFQDGKSGHAPYAFGQFDDTNPDGNDICHVSTLQPALEDFSQLDGGAPNPDLTYGETWSDVQIYTTAAVQGDQFTGTLTRTVNSCTVQYNVVGLWPSVACTNADPNDGHAVPDVQLCSPCAAPDAGMATGSGINPNFPIVCGQVYDVRDVFGRGGSCANLQTNPNNCGACGNACMMGQACIGGQCKNADPKNCPKPTQACGGTCTDTSSDPANCGKCGVACNPGETCDSGTCSLTATCPSDQAQCGGLPFYCLLSGSGTATGNSTLPQLNTDEPACAISM